jgi:flagella basal body P-ring formation protein FlgA
MNKAWRRVLLSILVTVGVCFSLPGQASSGYTATGAPVTVYLHKSALLKDPRYTLGQVASVLSSDPAQACLLDQLPLGPIPVRPMLLPARIIQERVASIVGEVVVIGSRVALLPGAAIPKGEQWFFSALLSYIDSQDTLKTGRIEIEMLKPPVLPDSSDSAVEAQGMASGWEDRIVFETNKSPYGSGYRSFSSAQTVPAGQMEITYKILSPRGDELPRFGNLEGSFRIWVHHFLPVARAKFDLLADQSLSEEVLTFNEEDISLLRSSFLTQEDALGRYRTTAPISHGERIERDRLQRFLAVRAGDRITITFIRPGLQIDLPGRAFRSGSFGDLIDVRADLTGKRFRGRITAAGEVSVESY